MRLIYIGMFESVELAETGEVFHRGKEAEVEEELGKRLLHQKSNWRAAKPPAGFPKGKAAAKKRSE